MKMTNQLNLIITEMTPRASTPTCDILLLITKMIKNLWRKVLKKDKLVLRKTDNELIRYIKQTNIISERKRYEDLMKEEDARKAKGLNDKEKRHLYFQDIASLQKQVYDKPYINDNHLDYSFLHDNANYKLNKRWRPFFLRPFYAKQTDFCEKVKGRVWAIRVVGSIILLKLGYEFGIWDSASQN